MAYVHTITGADVGLSHHQIAGRTWPVSGWIGSVLPGDVGKRVYLSGGILQVENDSQRASRLCSAETTSPMRADLVHWLRAMSALVLSEPTSRNRLEIVSDLMRQAADRLAECQATHHEDHQCEDHQWK